MAGRRSPSWTGVDPERPEEPPGRPRIVWADDNGDMRQYVARLLAQDYEVCAVGDGLAALAAARSQAPDLVLTHRREDLHQDHRTVAELTWNTFRDHLVLEYEIPKYEGDLGQPNVFVPLADAVARRKVELLLLHFASQRTRSWFRASTFEALMRLRAVECQAAEGFAEGLYGRKLRL